MKGISLGLWLLLLCGQGSATFRNFDKNIPEDDYYQPGDINLGLLEAIYWSKNKLCDTWDPGVIQAANAAIFRINEVNRDPDILPNITLGALIMSDCWDAATSLYRTTKLIPVDGCAEDCCELPVENATNPTVRGCYDVTALVSSYSSSMSVPQSRLLSMYKIPHISLGATADILSDRNQFGYFNRVVPPDKFQINVIMDLIVTFNWTYISLIGTPTVYSRNGITEIRVLAKKHGICIAYSVEILDDFYTDEDYDEVVRRLRRYSKARVVITFIENVRPILKAVTRAKAQGEFIFFGGDGITFNYKTSEVTAAMNGLRVTFSTKESKPYDDFEKYYKALSPWAHMNTSGIFEQHMPEYWKCSMDLEKGENGSCLNFEVLPDLPRHYIRTYHRLVVDGMNTLIFALDTMIRQRCPSAFNNKTILKECVTGPELLGFIRNTSFQGYRGPIRFDEKGDGMTDYEIKQSQPNGNGGSEEVVVGLFAVQEEKLYMDMEKITWFSLNETLYPTSIDTPESVCAKPCKEGEFYIQGELKCCWECRKCRDNEKVRDDFKGCMICPELTWPDQVNFTTCEPIAPTYMDWLDPIALGLVGLSGTGLLSTIVITYIFLKYRHKKVVKGSSLEQMMMIIVALYMSYMTAILLVAKPVYSLCLIQYYSFHLSCTLTFVPLLLKTTRLYRIFAAAEKCQQVVRFVSSKALGLFSLILITTVVTVLVVCTVFYELGERLQMPVTTDKFVELVCHISNETLLIPLSYNLLLLLLCAVYGFLTRKLPDNFNESWYIFISVSTTLFVWIAFLPTYSMAFYAYHKSALLGLALILNAVVTAVCLFAPKIYAIYYITEDSIKVTNFEGSSTTGGTTISTQK